jgi:Protein of unknown function (DUF1615)
MLDLSHPLYALRRLPALCVMAAFVLGLAACSTTSEPEPATIPSAPGKPGAKPPARTGSSSSARPGSPVSSAVSAPKPPPLPPMPSTYDLPQTIATLKRLMPARVTDASDWANDIGIAMGALRIPLTPDNVCSVLAVIEQESSFAADPEVPNLPALVKSEIELRRSRYSIPEVLVKKGLEQKSRDGRPWGARVDTLRTESDVSRLYEELSDLLPDIARKYQPDNPVHTAGAMQVNVAFAEEHIRAKPYPWGRVASVRRETFTRRGGLYFGVALLLDYKAPYDHPRYRFADYNAGRFASRNAAFQQALTRISGKALALDGDLLIYEKGTQPSPTPSNTQRVLESIAASLGVPRTDVRRELLLEKREDFERTRIWQRVFLMAEAAAKQSMPRFILPQISVQSPKFKRTLTTTGYAAQVENRWANCMARQRVGYAEGSPEPLLETLLLAAI